MAKIFLLHELGESNQGSVSQHEISAIVGPFNSIKWKFHGEEVDVKAMVRHYLEEFVKNSAR